MEIDKYTVNIDKSIKDAVRMMDKGGIGFIACVDREQKVLGIITDGDFRRSVLYGTPLDAPVTAIINRNFIYIGAGYETRDVEDIFNRTKVKQIPVLKDGRLVEVISEEIFYKQMSKSPIRRKALDVQVIIMAGGKGTRLAPFTNILPKPLIPIGDKPIIELIMDKFHEQGAQSFYLSLNYKGEMIKAYFNSSQVEYEINYIWEKEFAGTAGSLSLLPDDIGGTVIVSNCDTIVEADYDDLVGFHRSKGNLLTVVGSMQHFKIPYGILEYEKGGALSEISEKPEYDMVVNTGLYVLDRKALRYIPEKGTFNMTDLIKKLLSERLSVGVYPVSEGAYVDIGQWEEYKKNFEKLLHK